MQRNKSQNIILKLSYFKLILSDRLMDVINNFTRDVIITCGDDVITMSIVEDHVVIRIVELCSSLDNVSSSLKRSVSSHMPYTFTADFSTASVTTLNNFLSSLLYYHSHSQIL